VPLTTQTFSLRDHSTMWVRAATWFRSAPHSGLEFDNFLGSGPFQPMEGSHLCHKGHCINPNHAVFEEMRVNADRKQCNVLAYTLRRQGHPVPASCTEHQPPCLLQHASLTPYEAILIQLAVMAEARGLDSPVRPPNPGHPYLSFEGRLPPSSGCVALDRDHLVTDMTEPAPEERPVFRCSYCPVIRPFVSPLVFWGHIRDRHQLVPSSTRLEDVVRSGRLWLEYRATLKQGGKRDQDILNLARQTQEEGFAWDVVRGWKLEPARKRTFQESREE
jgi:hypothetical protein